MLAAGERAEMESFARGKCWGIARGKERIERMCDVFKQGTGQHKRWWKEWVGVVEGTALPPQSSRACDGGGDSIPASQQGFKPRCG